MNNPISKQVCSIHGLQDHGHCNFCGKEICTQCALEGKLKYFIFTGTTENPNEAYTVACNQGTHGFYIYVPPKIPITEMPSPEWKPISQQVSRIDFPFEGHL